MIRPVRFALLTLLTLLVLPVAVSAERVASLPAVAPSTSARFEIAEAFDGEAYVVGRGEVIAPNRMHYVLRTIPLTDEPQESIEIVIYDGRVFMRENDAERWEAEILSQPVDNPVATLVEGAEQAGPIERLGSVTIDGVETDQYHILIDNESERPFTTVDMWIGQQTSHLYQSQVTEYRGDDEFSYQLETVVRAYAFDDPTIMITPPDPATVDPIRGPVPWSFSSRGALTAAEVAPHALTSWRDGVLQRWLQR